jgi:hypothetical protein
MVFELIPDDPDVRFGVILRKSRIEHIGSGLPQIAAVNADVAESSVSARS